jgi:hypothetical protein
VSKLTVKSYSIVGMIDEMNLRKSRSDRSGCMRESEGRGLRGAGEGGEVKNLKVPIVTSCRL